MSTWKNLRSMVRQKYYRRLVCRCTARLCRRATQSPNDCLRILLMVTAVTADEIVAQLVGVDTASPRLFRKRIVKITGKQVLCAMRVYTSAILVSLAPYKDLVLAKTGYDEQNLLEEWSRVFEYTDEDKARFNDIFLSTGRQMGVDGLTEAASRSMATILFGSEKLESYETSAFKEILVGDALAIVRVIERFKEKGTTKHSLASRWRWNRSKKERAL